MGKKITPRDVINALQEILTGLKKNNRYRFADGALWIGRAKRLISEQAAEIEDLKEKLEEYTGNVQEPLPPPEPEVTE